MSRIWDCTGVPCPSCGAGVGRRCRPLGPPYKVRSKRLEVDVPHVTRLNMWRHKRRLDEESLRSD